MKIFEQDSYNDVWKMEKVIFKIPFITIINSKWNAIRWQYTIITHLHIFWKMFYIYKRTYYESQS